MTTEQRSLKISERAASLGKAFWSTWRSDRVNICFQCDRAIQYGDPYKFVLAYLVNDPVELIIHRDCRNHTHRPRLDPPQPIELNLQSGDKLIRRLIMAATPEQAALTADEATTAKKNDKPTKKSKKTTKEIPVSKKTKKGAKVAKAEKIEKSAEAEKPTKKSKKAAAGEKAVRADSILVSTAAKLKGILTSKKSVATIKQMAAGETPTNEAMLALRDDIKAVSAKLREDGDGSTASTLSSVNRLVRRIERSTR